MITGKGRLKFLEINLLQCHFIHHKFHMDFTEITLCSKKPITA
jgi:hypothetical protein